MEVVVAVALAAATGLIVGRVGGPAFDNVVTALAQLVGGYRPDGWPRGVQEEDRATPWGRASSAIAKSKLPPMPKPTMSRVRPSINTR